ncbi:MAG: hypothetical protein MUF18_12655 [Fimbriiglobus sp.]|jgi:hypothetical protein|nr:hypothetical protein [Fimbriiglobus sp.]
MIDNDNIVMLASGETVQVELWRVALAEEGLDGRVVGGALDAGLGTAIPHSAELWVRRCDVERATAVLRGMGIEGPST